eukprot:221308-Rhodomonas_salina.3
MMQSGSRGGERSTANNREGAERRRCMEPREAHGGKMTKSAADSPGTAPGQLSTVKMDGSGWSKEIVPIVLNLPRHDHTKSEQSCSDAKHAESWS